MTEWILRRKDDKFGIAWAPTGKELREYQKSTEGQVDIAAWLAPGDEIEIVRVKAETAPFCNGGCDGMNEDWYVETDKCDICGLPVRGF